MRLLKIILLLLFAAVVYSQSDNQLWHHISDKNWIASYAAENGIQGTLFLILFGAVFTACGGPRQLIAFIFGFTFGSITGLVYCLLGAIIGAIGSYFLAQFYLQPFVRRRFASRYQSFKNFVEHQPFTKVLIVRIFPVGSNLVTNLLSGVTGVPVLAFIGASLLGYLPQTLIFTLAGAGVGEADHWQLLSSIILGILSIVLTSHLYQRYKKLNTTSTL